MSRKKTDIVLMGVSVLSFFLLAISFLIMPLGNETLTEDVSANTILCGVLFWVSLITGITTQCVLAHRRKMWYQINRIRKIRVVQKIGLVSFFKNIGAAVADIFTAVSLVGFVVSMVVTDGVGYICYVMIALFVFSFSMHCILNGKIFYHVFNQDKLLQNVEKERAILSKQERKPKNV